jgi:hypothetical protein
MCSSPQWRLLSRIETFPATSPPMAPIHVARISASVWKWFCRCPDTIGPVHDISSDDEFHTLPTSPSRLGDAEEQAPRHVPSSSAVSMPHRLVVEAPLSPAQSARLRRRHAQAVLQLTTPPPVVAPKPQGKLLRYQIPIKVFRPSWAP